MSWKLLVEVMIYSAVIYGQVVVWGLSAINCLGPFFCTNPYFFRGCVCPCKLERLWIMIYRVYIVNGCNSLYRLIRAIMKRCDWQCICSVAIGRVVAVYTASICTPPSQVGKLKDLFLCRTNYSANLKKKWQYICSVVVGSVVAVHTASTLPSTN